MKTTPIMAHLVIGYPSLEESRQVAELYANRGMEILELQIPFSHPTADGQVLTDANRKAVQAGATLEKSLDFLADVRQKHPDQVIMAMTYANKVFAFGMEKFCDELQARQIKYLIIPDMPFDSVLAKPIHAHPYVQIVPVLSANTSEARLKIALANHPDYIYIMADYKITGQGFSIHPKIQALVQQIKAQSNAKVGLGFGISEKQQVEAVLEIADFAIIGSALTRAMNEGRLEAQVDAFID